MSTLKNAGKDVKVLDIGTGTGLLAMMAAKAQASSVTACEVSSLINLSGHNNNSILF